MTRTGAYSPTWSAFAPARIDCVLLGSMLLVCVGLLATSTKILLTSGWRDQGRVLSCVYFTGARTVEHQYLRAAGEGDFACPAVKVG